MNVIKHKYNYCCGYFGHAMGMRAQLCPGGAQQAIITATMSGISPHTLGADNVSPEQSTFWYKLAIPSELQEKPIAGRFTPH